MIVKLPVVAKKEFNEATQKVEKEFGTLNVEIDTSFKAHLKWEEQFASNMGGIDLRTYTERVQAMLAKGQPGQNEMLGLLKLLYCYINSNQLPTFKEFLGLFDFDVAEDILDKLGTVLEQVSKSASKN